jgi:hypothetical protein
MSQVPAIGTKAEPVTAYDHVSFWHISVLGPSARKRMKAKSFAAS